MANTMDRMNRSRKNALFVLLVGTIAAFLALYLSLFLSQSLLISQRFRMAWIRSGAAGVLPEIAAGLWFLLLMFFSIGYFRYRYRLKKENLPSLSRCDERIRLSWLRAFRSAFFVVLFLVVFWKWEETGFYPDALRFRLWIPNLPITIFFAAIISLLASFLWHSREAKNCEEE